MKKTNFLQKTENVIIVITFVVMVISVFLQVFNRNITKIPVTGFEELSKYCMIYMVLLGTELGLRDGTQIAVTAIPDKFKGRTRMVFLIIAKSILVLFAGIMFYQSIALCEIQLRSGQTSPGLGVPMVVPYLALFLSFGIITIVQFVSEIKMIIAFIKGDTADYEVVELSEEEILGVPIVVADSITEEGGKDV